VSGKVAFCIEQLTLLLEEAEAGPSGGVFQDAAHPTHNTPPSYVWTQAGKEFQPRSAAGSGSISTRPLNAHCPTQVHLGRKPTALTPKSTQRFFTKSCRGSTSTGPVYVIFCDN
jgi:hypothetical protein